MKCDYFFDDLVKVLENIKEPTKGILYDPKNKINTYKTKYRKVKSWSSLDTLYFKNDI